MPQEITKPTPLLKEDGSTVVGWASSNLLDYNKIDCAAPLARIKEWDRYTCLLYTSPAKAESLLKSPAFGVSTA